MGNKIFKFGNGVLTVPDDDIEAQIFLSFSDLNKDNQQYIKMESSLPKIKGLKSKKTRMKFAYELINNLSK